MIPRSCIFVAEIPLLDWAGSHFLVFYQAAFIIAVIWSLRRSGSKLSRLSVPGTREPDDPYEIAYLSGGPGRLVQLVVVRLLAAGLVRWSGRAAVPHLLAVPLETEAPALPDCERALLTLVRGRGETGLPLNECGAALATFAQAVEARLAILGLRPTLTERSGVALSAVLPLIALGVLGMLKLIAAVSRDRPVSFLIIALVITGGAAAIIVHFSDYLTPGGKEALERLRTRNQQLNRLWKSPDKHSERELSLGVALFGPYCLVGLQGYTSIARSLGEQIPAGSTRSSTSGCGGTGGCGGGCSAASASGGGGCGGCGGD